MTVNPLLNNYRTKHFNLLWLNLYSASVQRFKPVSGGELLRSRLPVPLDILIDTSKQT